MNDELHFNNNEKIMMMPCEQKGVEAHSHQFLELVYVTRGKALHTLNGIKSVVEEGDYFIIDYGALHQYDNIKGESFDIVNCLFKPEIVDKTLIDCHSFQKLITHYLIRFNYRSLRDVPTNFIYHDENGSIGALIDKLQSEYDEKSPGYIELMRCYLLEIILLTMRKISSRDTAFIANDYSEHIIQYVEGNYMKSLTLTSISKELNFSLPYISKRFKHDTGVTFSEYLQKTRMEQGCRLLANTDKKISEIAELVGYADIKFFHAVFKKHLKMTPRQFKKMHV